MVNTSGCIHIGLYYIIENIYIIVYIYIYIYSTFLKQGLQRALQIIGQEVPLL